MHNLNGIYVQQMVDAIRLDNEREYARRIELAGLPRSSLVVSVRRLIGASFIGAGRVISGRPKPEASAEPSA